MAKKPGGRHDWLRRNADGWECRRCGAVAILDRDQEFIYAKGGASLSRTIPSCRLTAEEYIEEVRGRLAPKLESRADLLEAIERKSGSKPGHLQRWLAGEGEIEFATLLVTLAELGENPREFFLGIAGLDPAPARSPETGPAVERPGGKRSS